MIIGLLGCRINNENLGCQALTYSLIAMLEDIARESGNEFTYYVFEAMANDASTDYACQMLNINSNRVNAYDVTPLFWKKSFVRHLKTGVHTLMKFIRCDVFIDMTGGDSFSDIYSQYTFDSETNVKLLVKKIDKKLILGPQTYGPYNKVKNRKKAIKAIKKADMVLSRDKRSKDYLASFMNTECYVTTDIAFTLPFSNMHTIHEKKRIAINVSGLLLNDKTETTILNQTLSADYDRYVCGIIDYFLDENCYEIHIVPHVGEDGNRWVFKQYGDRLIYHGPFDNPISAKSLISEMDIFIGARMHATIAAFSSGVITIPVAYSRKFSGLFENIGYPYIIDLTNMSTIECINKTIEFVDCSDLLKIKMKEVEGVWKGATVRTKNLIAQALLENMYE